MCSSLFVIFVFFPLKYFRTKRVFQSLHIHEYTDSRIDCMQARTQGQRCVCVTERLRPRLLSLPAQTLMTHCVHTAATVLTT